MTCFGIPAWICHHESYAVPPPSEQSRFTPLLAYAAPPPSRQVRWVNFLTPVGSLGVEATIDQLLLDETTDRVERRARESFAEFQVDPVLSGTVLDQARHDPVAESLDLLRAEFEIDPGDAVGLLGEHEDRVRL